MNLTIADTASKAVFYKTLRNMNLTALLLFFACLQVSAHTAGQTVTLSATNVPVQKIFKKISRQTGISIVYDELLLRKLPPITIHVKDAAITEVLNQCLNGVTFEFNADEKIIIIKKETQIVHKTVPIENLSPLSLDIHGIISDEAGNPLQGVSIVLKGSQIGTASDAQGRFHISIPGKGILVFSYVDYITEEIPVDNQTSINVSLALSQASMQNVVVVGYGTQLKKDVSGSITVVNEKNFNKGVNQTAADLLQGKVAGLVVTTETGDVTARQTIRLRGTSSLTGSSAPFVVIDGVPGMDLNSVAAQDIESISVLKDAAATAIYGSRSASGVILITTKKGKPGQTLVQLNNYVAIDKVANKPELLTADEWRKYASDNNLDITGLDLAGNTDWFDEIMRTGISNNHNLSLSGGTDKSSYRASFNYLNRQGIMRDNKVKRFNALFTVNQKALNERLNISLTAGAVQTDFSPTNNYNTVLAYTMLPVYTLRNPDGTWFEKFDFEQGNPVHNVEENRNDNKASQLYGNGNIKLKIIKGLSIGANFLKQRATQDASRYNAITTQAGRTDHGYAYRDNQVWDKNLLEFISEYEKEWKNNKFKILAGYSYEENYYQSLAASNRGFISDIFGYNNLTAGERLLPTDVNSYQELSKLISFFGRLNYSLHSKYTFTASLRRDGSSKFGKNNKWGLFPAVSGAWILSEEKFLSRSSFIDDLKLRVGYGAVGNQEGIGPYRSIALYGRGDEYFDNGQWRNTYRYIQNDNPDLKWEETSTLNVGIEFGLLSNKISGAIDYYVKKTKDLLYVYNVPVPPNLFPTTLANVGDMSNKGVEITINSENIKTSDFQWTSSFNFATNKNVITRLSDEIYQTESIKTGAINLRGSGNLTSHIVQEGKEVGTFYGWESLGLDDQGQYIFKDQNKDGDINSLDYTYIGRAMPRFSYGISNTFSYRRLSLSFFLRGISGNDVLNNPRLQYANVKWLPGSNVLREALTNGIKADPKFSSYYIEKGSFLRLDNASLSYDVNTGNLPGVRLARLYVTGQNLFLITRFKGLDPEVNMNGLAPGVLESFFVPKARTISVGIDVNF
ncbi:MAG: TonB-dependent receptor [Chitinophagaceae bacterium]